MKIPRSESLILFAFLGCVGLWAVSKCSAMRSDKVRLVRDLDEDEGTEDRPVRNDSIAATAQPANAPLNPAVSTLPQKSSVVKQQSPAPAPAQYTSTLRQPGAAPDHKTGTATPAAKSPDPTKPGTTLYVTIDGLKVRKVPGLKGETVEQLELYAPVTFLNQKSEFRQEISLGYEKVTDHWVKVRTASGKTGWVFGAGVHFYKMKREALGKDSKPSDAVSKKKN